MLPLQTGKMDKELFVKYLHSPAELNEEALSSLKQITMDYPWFQTGWMLYLMNLKKINHPDFETVLKKVAIAVPDRKRLFKYLNNEIKLTTADELQSFNASDYQLGDKAPITTGSLIDKFLNSNSGTIRQPKHGPDNEKSPNNKHIIEKSDTESDDLITETLANIYLQQKNYEKALDAFQKLSLKYPEKSIYFASRIKEIEVLKNNI